MARRTFDEWLEELRILVRQNLEVELEELPEFDRVDARSYYKDRSAPVLYFSECLSEHDEGGETLRELLEDT